MATTQDLSKLDPDLTYIDPATGEAVLDANGEFYLTNAQVQSAAGATPSGYLPVNSDTVPESTVQSATSTGSLSGPFLTVQNAINAAQQQSTPTGPISTVADAISNLEQNMASGVAGGTGDGSTTGGVTTAPTYDAAAADALRTTLQTAQTDPNAVIPADARQQVAVQEIAPDELMSTGVGQIGAQTPASTATAADPRAVEEIARMGTATMEPAMVGSGSQMQAVQGDLSDRSIITDPVTGELRPESRAEAVVREAPPEAFIRNQLTSLLTGMSGGEVPAWAQPAVDAAEARLAQRGMGNSSVARTELYNAIIQSALPIATGHAATAQQTFLANLNNEQQAVMFNAAQQANMDMANLNYLQKAQVMNAQSFLQLDFTNMNNEQRAAEINQQARQQAMLSDQAAENAARQFNASSENQTRQFMESLNAQIRESNATRALNMAQFNAGETNAMSRYNADLAFNRAKFNASNALAIEQSNVQWRRQVNTINTANQNAVNQAEAMNAFNLSNQALTFLWQEQRDNANWAWQGAQNAEERATRVAIAAMGNEAAADQMETQMWGEIGSAAVDIVGSWLLS